MGSEPTEPEAGMVLIVDDEPIFREMLKDSLVEEGFRVIEAGNGAEGVAEYVKRAFQIRLVILDLSMPVMGGQEAFRRMREINPNVKVILTSGYNAADVTRTFEGGGPAGFLQKPFATAALLAEIQKVGDHS